MSFKINDAGSYDSAIPTASAFHVLALRESQVFRGRSLIVSSQYHKMASEKQQYQSVPSSESFVSDDDDQSVTSSQSHERNTRARRVLWSIAQVTVVLVVIVQSIVIGLLGRSIPNSCQSARRSSNPALREHCLTFAIRRHATTPHRTSNHLPTFEIRIFRRR